MRIRMVCTVWWVLLTAAGSGASAADLTECVKLAVKPTGEASLTNGCTGRMNIMYCVDNPNSAKACSKQPISITTLSPTAADVLASYSSDGGGNVYWAICKYPEAPVNWTPGPANPYSCKKTCVMC